MTHYLRITNNPMLAQRDNPALGESAGCRGSEAGDHQ